MLNIIVCVKVVTDPEAPTSAFKIDPEGKHVLPAQGVPPVLNPYDENSLEAALKIKESQPVKITIISAGKSIPKAVIKKSLAVGADDLIVVEDGALEEADSYIIAFILIFILLVYVNEKFIYSWLIPNRSTGTYQFVQSIIVQIIY